jgi:hypothetical protein
MQTLHMKQLLFTFLFVSGSFFLSAQDSTAKAPEASVKHEITALTKTADSDKYALTGEFPVKVGTGKTGPANQRAYLELLRDAQGNPVTYKRIGGGCCPYKSKNALFGDDALVDRYEVTYRDKEGKEQKTIIYISFYDYEEPMIPVGFQAAASK